MRVLLAGICRTDLELVRGYRGFRGVPGHEFVGTLHALPTAAPGAALPQRPELTLGARVVAEINCVPADSAARSICSRTR